MDQTNGTPAPTNESVRRVADAAQNAADRTTDLAQEKLDQGLERAASTGDATASALRRAAEEVSVEHAWIGSVLRKSADGIESATQSLQGGNIERGVQDLTGFARRQPAIFLGGAFALGFALSRIGKTALEQASDQTASEARLTPQSGPMSGG